MREERELGTGSGSWQAVRPGRAPIVAVIGPFSGGTSCVAGVLHHLGVHMGRRFFAIGEREERRTFEEVSLGEICRDAFSEPDGERRMSSPALVARLEQWGDAQRCQAAAQRTIGGGKHPLLCLMVPEVLAAWRPARILRVVRPLDRVVGSLRRRGWWGDFDLRDCVGRLIAARDAALQGVDHLTVDYDRLVDDPLGVIDDIVGYLELAPAGPYRLAAVEFINPRLRRVS
ncbi:MAG: hypothetical protein ACREMB_03705 [Candidatus Rokuibacteriota bacterium]